MDDGGRLFSGRWRILRTLVLGTSPVVGLPRGNGGCCTLALVGGNTLCAGILGCASLRLGFRMDRTRLSGPVCSAAAAGRRRLLPPRTQPDLRRRCCRVDRALDCARARELGGHRFRCYRDPWRALVCGLLRRANTAKEVRSELREVLPQCATLVAACAGLGQDIIMQNRTKMKGVKVLFIAGFGPIDRDIAASRKLYSEVLGISFKEDAGGYLYTAALAGAKHFAVWPLSQAAESCFGKSTWPASIPVPQGWVEFEVDSVEKATAELESQGYRMLINNKREPWGQTVSRFISPEGLLVGVTYTPSMREEK